MAKHFIQLALFVCVFFAATHLQAQQPRTFLKTFTEHFNDTASPFFRYGSTGTKAPFKWKLGSQSAKENGTRVLSFKLDPSDSAGPGRGPEIISKGFTHFGTYSARLKVPDVRKTQPNTGAVVGYFTYHMDTIAGLSEIDFEWLIADPTVIYVGTWTGKHGQLQRVGRTLNLAKGIIYQTEHKVNHNGTCSPLTGMQNQPDTITAIPDFDASANFYTYGFDWYPHRICWWMLHPKTNEKIILWDYRGSPLGIPTNPSLYRINFWHTNNWSVHTNPASLEKPKGQYELEVDWISYEPWY